MECHITSDPQKILARCCLYLASWLTMRRRKIVGSRCCSQFLPGQMFCKRSIHRAGSNCHDVAIELCLYRQISRQDFTDHREQYDCCTSDAAVTFNGCQRPLARRCCKGARHDISRAALTAFNQENHSSCFMCRHVVIKTTQNKSVTAALKYWQRRALIHQSGRKKPLTAVVDEIVHRNRRR